MNEERSSAAYLALAFLALGVLIGTLVAMSAQSLAQTVVAALFALFGGSLLVMLEKLGVRNQVKAALAILAISVGTLSGLYVGLYVNEHQLLTPQTLRAATGDGLAQTRLANKYLRENVIAEADAIDSKYRNGMPAKEAYEQLRALLEKK